MTPRYNSLLEEIYCLLLQNHPHTGIISQNFQDTRVIFHKISNIHDQTVDGLLSFDKGNSSKLNCKVSSLDFPRYQNLSTSSWRPFANVLEPCLTCKAGAGEAGTCVTKRRASSSLLFLLLSTGGGVAISVVTSDGSPSPRATSPRATQALFFSSKVIGQSRLRPRFW